MQDLNLVIIKSLNKLNGILLKNNWPLIFKIIKVIKVKERLF